MDKNKILDQIKTNSNLLSLPQVLSEIILETAKEDFSADKLGDIILKDPALTGRILKMSNSSFYNRMSEIKTVHQAISIMGVTTVKCLALSSSIFHPEKIEQNTGIDAKKFFAYILSVATAAKKIAVAIDHESPEEAFVAGLLHDIGHMYLMHYYPKQVVQILNHNDGQKSINLIEKDILGVDHTEISKAIAEAWKLPVEIINAIEDHHNVQEISEDKTKNIVRLSVLFAKDSFSGFDHSIEDRLSGIAKLSKQLNLKEEDINNISSTLINDTLEFASFLGVDIGDVEEMLMMANQEIWKSYLCIESLYKERQELTKSLLAEERNRGAIESKNIAMATLSHYLNNAVMAIFGRTQLVRMYLDRGNNDAILKSIPDTVEKIDLSVRKIVAVIEEMKEVSPIDQQKFDSMSKAMNIDDLIETRLTNMKDDARLHDAMIK